MIYKTFDDINEQDLQELINNEVLESKTLDYKEMMSGNKDSDKKEFLADVSSFANSSGGYIIYGIKEEKGVPKELVGLDMIKEEVDTKILAIESLIRQGIEPRISGVKTKAIELNNGRYAIVIHSPKSWRSPHCVSYKNSSKFYARSSNGKYQLDVGELRVAFNLSETIIDRIQKFREDRIARIIADEVSVPVGNKSKIILHMIPIEAFNISNRVDVKDIQRESNNLSPMSCSSWNRRINFDGYLLHSGEREGTIYSYTQIFSNGVVEAVNSSMLNYNKQLRINGIERILIEFANKYMLLLKNLNVSLPIFLFITMTNVKGYRYCINGFSEGEAIDKDTLIIPGIAINNYDIDMGSNLKPCFDSIWNACGMLKSYNYDEDGKRIR